MQTLNDFLGPVGPLIAALGLFLALWRISQELPPRTARIFQWAAYAGAMAFMLLGWEEWSSNALLALFGLFGVIGAIRDTVRART